MVSNVLKLDKLNKLDDERVVKKLSYSEYKDFNAAFNYFASEKVIWDYVNDDKNETLYKVIVLWKYVIKREDKILETYKILKSYTSDIDLINNMNKYYWENVYVRNMNIYGIENKIKFMFTDKNVYNVDKDTIERCYSVLMMLFRKCLIND